MCHQEEGGYCTAALGKGCCGTSVVGIGVIAVPRKPAGFEPGPDLTLTLESFFVPPPGGGLCF